MVKRFGGTLLSGVLDPHAAQIMIYPQVFHCANTFLLILSKFLVN